MHIRALYGIPSIALLVRHVIQPLGTLVQSQGQVLSFAEIVQVHMVVVASQCSIDAHASVHILSVIGVLHRPHVNDSRSVLRWSELRLVLL